MRYFLTIGLVLSPCVLSALPTVGPARGDEAPLDIGSRRELFVDRYLIDKLDNLRLKLHEPRSEGTVLKLDQPWEGPFCGYTTVFKDGDRYRMYYRGTTSDLTREFTCYVESRDGVHWTRPELGLVEFQGSNQNNIILAGLPECHGFAPFLDTRPGVPANQRYKALGPEFGPKYSKNHLTAWVSGDGIRWHRFRDEPVIAKKHMPFEYHHLFDCLNLAFWSESEQSYLCYFRVSGTAPDNVFRQIGRTMSKDFVTWTPAIIMEQVRDDGSGPKPAPEENLYTNQTTPYFRAPHLYIALPSRFMEGKDAVSSETRTKLGVHKYYLPAGSGFNDMPLMTSRGGNRYDRTFLEAWIRPGLDLKNWTSRANYPACGIVPCTDDPTRLAIYVDRHTGYPSAYIERLTLRNDGFISVNAPYAGGELVTKPLTFAGKSLSINLSTSAAGSIRVEIQDAAGQPIPGHALTDCPEIVGDEIERTVSWKRGTDLSRLAGQPVRLRFVMKDADLYALRFREEQ